MFIIIGTTASSVDCNNQLVVNKKTVHFNDIYFSLHSFNDICRDFVQKIKLFIFYI